MECYNEFTPVESYSSYKKKIFNKHLERARLIKNGIDDNSLKAKDKTLLKNKLSELFNF